MNNIRSVVSRRRSSRQFWMAIGLLFPWVFLGAVAVLADYIGPQRSWTSTEYHREYCNYRATTRPPAAFGVCNLTLYNSPGSCPGTGSVAGYFNNAATACGASWPGTCGASISCSIALLGSGEEGCSAGEPGCTSVTVSHNDPPATVSGTASCTQWGNAGWCRGDATLALSGTEPVGGHALTYFESDTNGILCSAPGCSWTFPQGVTNMNYWVHSDYGDTSTFSSVSMSVDSLAPTLALNVPAPDGSNGWYRSNVTVTASAADATSGVSGSPSINGGGNSISLTVDGTYTLIATVADIAGNVATNTTTIRRDGTPPVPGISMPAVPASGWFSSAVTITPNGADATSGLASQQVSIDNINWGASLTLSTSGNYTVTARFTDNAGNTSTTTRSVSVDVTNPSVVFNAPAPDGSNGWYRSAVTVSAGGTDAHSGVNSQQVSLDHASWSPSVTLSGDGNHTVYARVTDHAGNVANATRTVGIDSMPPLTGFSLPAPDGLNGWYVHPVTVTPDGSDATSGIASQQVSLDNSTWTSSVTVTANGAQTVYMQITDRAGNSATASRTISLDRTAPTPGFAVPAPTGSNGWYVSPVTITPNGADAVSGVASQQVSLNSITWFPSLTISADGNYTVYTRIVDNAGNTAASTRTVNYDSTAPVPGFSAPPPDGANGWYVHAVTIAPNGSDATSGVSSQQVSLNNTTWDPSVTLSVDGTYTVYTRITDLAGNTAASTRTYRLDATLPDAGFSMDAPDGANGWYVHPVPVTPTGSDATSGVASRLVSSDNATWLPSLTFSADGNYTVYARVIDNAGNSRTVSRAVHVDRTAPTPGISIPPPDGLGGWYVTAPTAMPGGSDATSGVASQQVSLDNASWSSSVTVSADGARTIYMRISDNAGNTSTTTRTVQVDLTAPVADVSLPVVDGLNGWYVSAVTASPAGSDATSGVASQSVSLDNASWSPSASITTDGTYTVYMRIRDAAGNSATTTRTVQLDRTAPVPAISLPPMDGLNGWYVSPITATPGGSDATSGIASQEVSTNNSTWTPTASISIDGTYTVYMCISDVAGNTASTTRVVRLDTTDPVPGFSMPAPDGANDWHVSAFTVSPRGLDSTSGVDTQEVSLNNIDWSPSVDVSADGSYTVSMRVTDIAGNTASASQLVHLDATPPAASMDYPPADGLAGWHVSPVTITPRGTDATAGVAAEAISIDNTNWHPAMTLAADGAYTVYARIVDAAGNTTTITRAFHLDRTAPVVTVSTPPPGASGWYTSPTVFSVDATDPTSGVATTRYAVDGGAWGAAAPALSDGRHSVQARVADVAGNVIINSYSLNVDSIPPVSAFLSPVEGSTTTVHGTITMTGSTADATSGAASAEISLDNGSHWFPLALGEGGSWSYPWDTTRVRDGTHVVLVRAVDLAGNEEQPVRITLVVANKPVDVSITPLWTVWGHADVTIHPGSSPVVQATITVHDPKSRWQDLVVEYDGSNLPESFTWTGRMGDGSIAYAGRYEVSLRAWDAYGNYDQAVGWVIILLAPTPTPSPTQAPPTDTPQATPTLPSIVFVPPTPTLQVVVPTPVPQVEPPAEAVQKVEKATIQRILWPVFGFIAMLIVLASASLSDHRPQELRALARLMDRNREIQKTYSSEE